jgi:hypothetical protein
MLACAWYAVGGSLYPLADWREAVSRQPSAVSGCSYEWGGLPEAPSTLSDCTCFFWTTEFLHQFLRNVAVN